MKRGKSLSRTLLILAALLAVAPPPLHAAERVELNSAKAPPSPFQIRRAMSLTALMEPPVFGVMEPLTGADLRSRTG